MGLRQHAKADIGRCRARRATPRQVVMQAAKNGFYYILDRRSGELLSAHNFAFVNWTRGIDAKTGRPLVDPHADYNHGPALVFPSEAVRTAGSRWPTTLNAA
jgi:hypothetical protein